MLRVLTGLTLLMSAQLAKAQDQAPNMAPNLAPNMMPPFVGGSTVPPTDLPSGIGAYCIYENQIYSIGSPLCIHRSGYICAPKTNDADFSQRAYWTGRPVNPNLVLPVCE